jgi:hypothetical protein
LLERLHSLSTADEVDMARFFNSPAGDKIKDLAAGLKLAESTRGRKRTLGQEDDDDEPTKVIDKREPQATEERVYSKSA